MRALLKRRAPHLPGRAAAAFADSYLLRAGWLDGRAGLDWALARAWFYWRIGVERRAISVQNAARGAPATAPDARESASKVSE
jgi:hypothetical protein